MAPLGADEEAAGTPPSPQDVGLALRTETAGPQHRNRSPDSLGSAWVLVAFVVLLIAAAIGWAVVGR
jgi:hypothetical protein